MTKHTATTYVECQKMRLTELIDYYDDLVEDAEAERKAAKENGGGS